MTSRQFFASFADSVMACANGELRLEASRRQIALIMELARIRTDEYIYRSAAV